MHPLEAIRLPSERPVPSCQPSAASLLMPTAVAITAWPAKVSIAAPTPSRGMTDDSPLPAMKFAGATQSLVWPHDFLVVVVASWRPLGMQSACRLPSVMALAAT